MPFLNIPTPVKEFLRAAESRDACGMSSTFSNDAVLLDRGNEFRGTAVDNWCKLFAGTYISVRPVNSARQNGMTILTVIAVNARDLQPSAPPLQLEWWFTARDEKISALRITNREIPDLPGPVAAYVQATNAFNIEDLLATFADDALVNDQLHDYWGMSTIREWATRDIIGQNITMYVVRVVEHYGNVIVTANVDGNYDKRGLPDPLVLSFYFSPQGNKIVQLIILRSGSDA